MGFKHGSGRGSRPLFALLFLAALLAVLAALLLQALVLQVYAVPSSSMSPTLQVGDRVIVDKASLAWRPVARGDVVVFDATDVWTPATNGLLVVKRVIAVGGDHVSCCGSSGRLRLNGHELPEPYAHGANRHFDVTVPTDRLWVMGDDRDHSLDSSAYLGTPGGGSVPVNHVLGRAIAVAWPCTHAGILGTPSPKEAHDAA